MLQVPPTSKAVEAEQLRFDWLPLVPVKRRGSIQEQFEEFHRLNPHVYRLLRRMAREYRDAGNRHCGMKALWETLRFNSGVQTRGNGYKLDNNFTSRYARLLMEQEPDLAGFFETRETVEVSRSLRPRSIRR